MSTRLLFECFGFVVCIATTGAAVVVDCVVATVVVDCVVDCVVAAVVDCVTAIVVVGASVAVKIALQTRSIKLVPLTSVYSLELHDFHGLHVVPMKPLKGWNFPCSHSRHDASEVFVPLARLEPALQFFHRVQVLPPY